MIPKVIHYCWFGGGVLPDKVQANINTWKEFLPDFEIKQWNESNFDVYRWEYTQEAYYAKRYAFVSDVARLVALVEEGGLYLDTDVRILKQVPMEMFRQKAFVGFEHDVFFGTGIIATEAHNSVFEEFLKQYDNLHYFEGVKFSLITNVNRFTKIMVKNGFLQNNQYQVQSGFAVYPQILLCGNDWKKGSYATKETIFFHDFQSTWGQERRKNLFRYKLNCVKTVIMWKLLKLLNINVTLYNAKD